MKSLRSSTLAALGWSGTAQVVQQLLQFIFSVILARLLSPHEFGLIGMIVVFTGFASLFSELGLGAALIQKIDIDEGHLNSVFWINVAAGIVLTGIVAASAPLITKFYNEPVLRLIIMVIALNFFVGSLNIVQRTLFRKNLNFRRLAQIQITSIFVGGLTAIIMAFRGLGVWSLVAQSLVVTTISMILMWWFSPWRPSFSFDTKSLKELLGFSSNLLGFDIFNYWARNLDNLLIGRFIGSSALGIYSCAYKLMILPISQISGIISQVMFPVLSIIQNDIERVKRIYLRSTRSIALITFPVMTGLFVVANPFILSIYGAKWAGVIPILKILCLIGVVQSVGTTVGWIYTSQGRTDIMFKWGIFSGVVRAILFVIGLRWGVIGVALCYVIGSYLILLYPGWAIPGKLIGMRFIEMLKNLSGPFFCSVVMGVVIWALGFILLQNQPPWISLTVQVPIGIILYISLIHFFKVRSYIETLELVTEYWHKQKNSRVSLKTG